MLKIGLTGNIASGKSAVENMFKSLGVPVIDADRVCHDLYKDKSVQDKIKLTFLNEDIFENSQISRKKLGNIVFESKEKKQDLENILHPLIIQKIKDFFELNKDQKIIVASVPLLFEAKMEKIFDKIIIVCCDDKTRLQRIINRDNVSETQAWARIKSQMPQTEKISMSDFIINNNGSLEETNNQLKYIIKKLD